MSWNFSSIKRVRFSSISVLLLLCFTATLQAQVVNVFKGDRFTHYQPEDWISYAPSLDITSIDISEDHILFATAKGGIIRFDKYANRWDTPYTKSTGLRSNHVYEIVYNELDGALYARTPKGIDVLYFSENFWRPSDKSAMPQKRVPDISAVASLKKQKDFRFPRFYRPPNSFLPDFFTDISLNYVLPDKIFDQQNREFKIRDRVTDQWQRLWFATDGFGVLQADLFTYNMQAAHFALPNISPRDVFFNQQSTWIGGIGNDENYNSIKGITRLEERNAKWDYFEAPFINGLYGDNVQAIDGDENYIALATTQGVAVYDIRKNRWRSVDGRHGLDDDNTHDVLLFDNTVFAATESGLNQITVPDMNVSSPFYKPLSSRRINRLATDGEKVWIAAISGLFTFNTVDETFERIDIAAPFPDNYISAIYVDDEQLWVANDFGIAVLDRKQNTWHSFTELTKKIHINDILKIDNSVWFGTNKGLLKYDITNNFWRLFDLRDGLMSKIVYRVDVKDDQLWLSTDAGLTLFRFQRAGRID